MPTEALKSKHGVILRAASGNLQAGETVLPLFDLGGHRRAIVHITLEANLVTPDADDRVRFYLDTAYGAGIFADSTANLLDDPLAGGPGAGIPPNASDVIATSNGAVFEVGDIIRIDNERMLVTAIATNDLTVRRGQDGTPVEQHAVNTDIFLQDVDWITVANVTYDNSDNGTAPECVIVIGSTDIAPVILDDLDEALADNTILAAALGDRLRLRTTVAGATAPTYNYSARAAFQN